MMCAISEVADLFVFFSHVKHGVIFVFQLQSATEQMLEQFCNDVLHGAVGSVFAAVTS